MACQISRSLAVWFVLIAAALAEPPEQALRYHELLLKRPEPGAVFERFCQAWAGEATFDALTAFLENRAKSGNAADGVILGLFWLREGEEARALAAFETVTMRFPQDPDGWLAKARLETRRGENEAAVAALEAALGTNLSEKQREEALLALGRQLARLGRRDEALARWQELLEANPGDETFEDVVDLQVEEGLTDDAIATALTWIEKLDDPYRKALARLRLAEIRTLRDERAESLQVLGEVLEQSGQGTWLEREILARIEAQFRRSDDLDGLQEHVAKLAEAHPKRIAILRAQAMLLAESGDKSGADEAFGKILDLTPGDRKTREAYVALLDRLELHEKAVAQAEALGGDGEWKLRIAGLQHRAGKTAAARESVAAYLESSDKSQFAYLRAARALEQFEQHEAAEETYRAMREAFPQSLEPREALAAFLFRLDRRDEAIAEWRAAAKAGDGRDAARIARVLSSRNQPGPAYDLLHERVEEFASDPGFLAQLCQAAIPLAKTREVIPQARRLVILAEGANQLGDALNLAGKVILQSGDLPKVVEELRAIDKPAIQQSCLLAELLDLAGNRPDAEAVLAKIDGTGAALAAEQRIRMHSRAKDYAAAAQVAEAALDLPGNRTPGNLKRLVEIHQRAGDFQAAVRWVGEWKQVQSGRPTPFLKEADLLQRTGRETEALAVLEQAARKFPDESYVRSKLAQTYADTGRQTQAEREFRRLYETEESEATRIRWALKWADAASALGRLHLVTAEFEERRRRSGGSTFPLRVLAAIHAQNGDHEREIERLREALGIEPKNLDLHLKLATAREKSGDPEAAIRTLEAARQHDRGEVILKRLASTHMRLGNESEGLRLLFSAEGGMSPDDFEAVAQRLAGSAGWLTLHELAAPMLAANPHDFRLHYLAAIAREEVGESQAAMEGFLRILEMDPNLAKSPRQAKPATDETKPEIDAWDGFSLPAGAETFFRQRRFQAYSYRSESHWMMTARGWVQSQGNRVALPENFDDARTLALRHLRGIVYDDGLEPESLAERISAAGIPHAPALLDLREPSARYSYQPVTPVLRKHPQNLALWADAVVNRRYQMAGEDFVAAYELFRQDYPELALIAAVWGIDSDEAQGLMERAAEETLPRVEAPSDRLLELLGTSRTSQDAVVGFLGETYVRWFENADDPEIRAALLAGVAALTLKQDGVAAWVDLLQAELARYRKNPDETPDDGQFHPRVYTSQSYQALVRSMGRVPPGLPDFPAPVLAQVRPADGNGRNANLRSWTKLDAAERERILTGVRDRTLRFLLIFGTADAEKIDAAIVKLEGDPQATAGEILTAAAWLSSTFRAPAATPLFLRARKLTGDATWRKRIDGALAFNAQMPGAGDIDREAAREALVRLAPVAKGRDQHLHLLDEAEKLGMKKQMVARLGSAPPPTNQRNSFPGSSAGSALTPEMRLNRLTGAGKTKEAATVLYSLLRRSVGGFLTPGGRFDGDIEDWNRAVKGNRGAVQQFVLERFGTNRRESLDALGLARLGAIRELLAFDSSNRERRAGAEAQADYRAALKLDPGLAVPRSQLILANLGDEKTAVELLLAAPPDSIFNVISVLTENWRNTDYNMADRPPLARTVAAALPKLAKIAEKSGDSLGWTETVLTGITQAANFDGEGYVQVRGSNYGYGRTIGGKELAGYREAARKAGEALIAAMESVEIGDLQRAVFRHRCLIAQTGEDEPGALTAAAEKALASALAGEESVPDLGRTQREHVGVDLHPAEYLLRDAGRRGERNSGSAVIAQVRKAGWEKLAAHLERYAALYAGADEDFAAAADAFVESPEAGAAIERVILAWKDRGAPGDISALVLARLLENPAQYYNAQGQLTRYLEALVELGKWQAATQVCAKIADRFAGPKEHRQELLGLYASQQYWQRTQGSATDLFGDFLSMMSRLAKQPELYAVAVTATRGLEQQTGRYSYFRLPKASEPYDSAAAAIALLHNTPCLGEAHEFRAMPLPNGLDRTLFGLVLSRLARSDEAVRNEVVAYLDGLPRKTFASTFARAYLRENPANWLGFWINARKAGLERMRGDERAALAAIAGDRIKGKKITDEQKSRLARLLGENLEAARGLAGRILSAKSPTELNLGSTLAKLRGQIDEMIVADPVQAADAVEKAALLTRQWQAAKPGQNPVNSLYRTFDSILREAWDDDPPLEVLPFFMRVANSPILGRNLVLHGYWIDEAADVLDRAVEAEKGGTESERMMRVFGRLGELCQGQRVDLMARLGFMYLHDLPLPERKPLFRKLQAAEKRGEHAELARALRMGLRLHWLTHEWEQGRYPPGRPMNEEQQFFFDRVQDESLSLAWRGSFAWQLAKCNDEQVLSADVAYAIAEFLAEAMQQADFAIDDDIIGEICLAFDHAERRETWQALADRLVAGWRAVLRREANRQQPTADAFSVGSVLSGRMLRFLAGAGATSDLNRLLQQHGDSLRKYPDTVVLLVERGQTDVAAGLFRQTWATQQWHYNNAKHLGPPPAALGEFLAKIPEPDLKFYAELLIAHTPDGKVNRGGKIGPPKPNFHERVGALAKRFREIEWSSEKLRHKALSRLAVSRIAARELYPELTKELENFSAGKIQEAGSSLEVRGQMWMARGEIMGALYRGDAGPLARHLGEVNDAEEDSGRRWTQYEIVEDLVPVLDQVWRKNPEKLAEQLIPVCRHYLEADDLYNSGATSFLMGVNIVSHILLGRLNEHETWWAALPEAKRKKCLDWGRRYSRIFRVMQCLHDAKRVGETPVADRAALLREIWKTDYLRQTFAFRAQVSRQLVTQNLFTDAEIAENLAELDEALPRGGWAAYERARILSNLGRPDDALNVLEVAWKLGESTKKQPAWFGKLVLARAHIFLAEERWEEARKALEADYPDGAKAPPMLRERAELLRRIEETSK